MKTPAMPLWRRWLKSWRSCWRAAVSFARQMQDRLGRNHWQKKQEIMNMSIELSHDELLVLYDLIHRLEDAEEIFEDLAERQVLWHIQTQLEKELVERFQTDYIALVTCALYVMYKRRKEKGCPLWSAVTASLFPAYLVSLIGLTLFSRMIGDVYYFMFYHQAPWPVGEGGYQWFSLIYDFKLDFFRDFSAENIGNILLFLPFGMLYPLANCRRLGKRLSVRARALPQVHPALSWLLLLRCGLGSTGLRVCAGACLLRV